MNKSSLNIHTKNVIGFRLFPMGPILFRSSEIEKIKILMHKNASWAANRDREGIEKMICNSTEVITLWNNQKLIGFGRANSDCQYRAVLWDIIVDKYHLGKGYGKRIVQDLISRKKLNEVEKIYIMTTNCSEFYRNIGFKESKKQKLFYRKIHP